MGIKETYQENHKIFESGIDSRVEKSPYDFTNDELDALEQEINRQSQQLGKETVLVEWGQPFGGPLRARKYHSQSVIQGLIDLYSKDDMRGICPKAGAVFDISWIYEQRKRKKRLSSESIPEFDVDKYLEFVQNTRF